VDFHLKDEDRDMKISLAVVSLLFFAVCAQAQTHGGSSAPGAQLSFSGGTSPGGLSAGSLSFSMPVIDRSMEHNMPVYGQGSATTFEPTRFVSYATAMKLGKEALEYRPKSIVEVAAECRAARKKLEATNGAKE
jgi:hypothetical protein